MDLQVFETKNGGDVLKIPGNLSVIQGFGNMPYILMFGGNVEQDTPSSRLATDQAFDYWGNSLLIDNVTARFNSRTERVLNTTALNSTGRLRIEEAVNYDLTYLRSFAEVIVDVEIIATNKVSIFITIKSSTKEWDFIYIFDNTTKTITPVGDNVWDFTFDPSFG
jgi:hypothetical protein